MRSAFTICKNLLGPSFVLFQVPLPEDLFDFMPHLASEEKTSNFFLVILFQNFLLLYKGKAEIAPTKQQLLNLSLIDKAVSVNINVSLDMTNILAYMYFSLQFTLR
jgi:hypothetical protein